MKRIRTIKAVKYITPLREGGSLPAIIEGDDEALYAMKFKGAGQGKKALIAELIAGEIARYLGFNVPEIVFVELNPVIGRTEPDPEIQDLLKASAGLNIALRYLSQASSFNLFVSPKLSVEFASRLVWFDAFVTNIDRTPKNVNMLIQNNKIWLIDHGASLIFHHNWNDHLQQSCNPFKMIRDHVLLPLSRDIHAIDKMIKRQFDDITFRKIVDSIPNEWLEPNQLFTHAQQLKDAYVEYLSYRLENSSIFVEEANRARTNLV